MAKKTHKAKPLRVVQYETWMGPVVKNVRGGLRDAVNRAPKGTMGITVSGKHVSTRKVKSASMLETKLVLGNVQRGPRGAETRCFIDRAGQNMHCAGTKGGPAPKVRKAKAPKAPKARKAKRPRTEKQLANDAKLAERARARRSGGEIVQVGVRANPYWGY